MTKDELKLALKHAKRDERHLSNAETRYWCDQYKLLATQAIEALAQPEQTNTRPYYTIDELNAWADEKEKQAWRNAAIRIGEELSSVGPDGYYDMNAWQWLDWAMENVKKTQPEQKPVAWMVWGENNVPSLTFTKPSDKYVFDSLYMTPPQRKPLTDEEIMNIAKVSCIGVSPQEDTLNFAKVIEAVHGIKGEA
jgi:hypothetical protein